MSDEFLLGDQDVVSMGVDQSFAKTPTSKVSELKQGMISKCLGDIFSSWVTNGVNGQVLLESGGGWQKGKIRLRLEFIPETPPRPLQDPNSPLADLRSNLDI